MNPSLYPIDFTSMPLKPHERSKLDPSSDRDFYLYPRFVTHVDDGFIDQLTELYRSQLSAHSRILDLMSSWVSHLPEEMEFSHVEGHGLNEEELAKNSRLDHYFVQDLNDNPQLTARKWFGKNPIRIIIDLQCCLPQHLNIFTDGLPTLVFTLVPKQDTPTVSYLKVNNKEHFIVEILETLHQKNIQILLFRQYFLAL
jgi:hypothetical protein